jgi:hypothetical protein
MLDGSGCVATVRAVLVAGCALLLPLEGAAQESPCDRGLEALARGPHGYVLRGNRCEGIYAQQVSGSALWVASFTRSFEEYDLTSGADLRSVGRPGASASDCGLRGLGRLYYRMDAVGSAASKSFHWPSDLPPNTSRGKIGVLGWTRYSVGASIATCMSLFAYDSMTPFLRPTATSSCCSPRWSSRRSISSQGSGRTAVRELHRAGKRLWYGFYPAERPVRIKLRGLGDPGVYHLEIGAELAAGGSAALTYWIYHDRRPRPQ